MIYFRKMHGLGNDFVIIDCRENDLKFSKDDIVRIADRNKGIGCDLVVLIERSTSFQEMNFLRLINADGSEIESCGNASRCAADLLMAEDGVKHIVLETLGGSLNCWREKDGNIRIEMPTPRLKWQEIPLSKACDTLLLPLEGDPVAVNVGNPHCVFFINASGAQARNLITSSAQALDGSSVKQGSDVGQWSHDEIEAHGRPVENNKLFPRKTNVEFVNVLSPEHIRMRVWERGVGVTQACGTGACASVVAAIRRGLTERKVRVTLDGGELLIHWPEDDAPISMIGPATFVFDGKITL